jgi:CheY-like chemotaxis protein
MRQNSSPTARPAAPSPSGGCRAPQALVLIIDENHVVRSLVGRTLELGGYDVLEADGPKSGRQPLAAFVVALAIVDMQLSDGDGIALMREIRQAQPGLPLLAISAAVGGTLREQLADAGLQHRTWTLTKPFTPGELLHTIARLLAA